MHLHGGVAAASSSTGTRTTRSPTARSGCTSTSNVARSATLWYHDHVHGETHLTLFAGLAGFYLLDDKNDQALDLPQGDYDVPLMIQDRSFNADGSFRYRFDLDRGFRGDTILVNGAVAPRMKVERRPYRLRFLNASNARVQARAGQRAQDGQIG